MIKKIVLCGTLLCGAAIFTQSCHGQSVVESAAEATANVGVSHGTRMDNSSLAQYASDYQYSGDEAVILNYNDEACGASSVNLTSAYKISSTRLAAITLDAGCAVSTITYWEMTENQPNTIRAFSEVAAGRSEHFANWGPSGDPGSSYTYEQTLKMANEISSLVR
jgi:hypothetical protein